MLAQSLVLKPMVDSKVRAVVLDWLMEVSDEFGFKRTTYHLASQIFDSFLSKVEKSKMEL